MTYRIKEDDPSPPGKGKPAIPPAPKAVVPPKQKSAKPVTKPPKVVPPQPQKPVGRLVSLDAFRGFVMLLLAAEGFGLRQLLQSPSDNPLWTIVNRESLERVAFHFQHAPWLSSFVPGTHDASVGNPWMRLGASFWDLIQPAFMFMVGVAMPVSFLRRLEMGASATSRLLHALLRSVVLVLLGVFLYSLHSSSTNWVFTNVLAQIGLGYFFVYLLVGRSPVVQVAALVVVLAGVGAALQFSPQAPYHPDAVNASVERGEVLAPPYRQWSKNGNLFHQADLWLLNQFPRPAEQGPFLFNEGGYQTLNFVPAMGTMILGLLCGQLMISGIPPSRKLMFLVLAALVCWGLGVVLGATCNPVIKRIWSPSWVLFSGGYVIGMLALFYLLFDLLPFEKLAFPLVVVGMNSIVVYLTGFLLTGWLAQNMQRHFGWAIDPLLGWMADRFHLTEAAAQLSMTPAQLMQTAFAPVIGSILALSAIWLLALWLYRQKVFIRI